MIPRRLADEPAPFEVTTYARDADISEAEARRRLDEQRRATHLRDAARNRLGDAFGGLWIEPEDDDRVKLAIVAPEHQPASGTRKEAEALVEAYALTHAVDLVDTHRSERALLELQRELETALVAVNRDAPRSIDVVADVKTGTVEVCRPSDPWLTRAQAQFLAAADAAHGDRLRIEVSDRVLRFDRRSPGWFT